MSSFFSNARTSGYVVRTIAHQSKHVDNLVSVLDFILALLIAVVDFLPLLGTGLVLIPWAAVSLLLGEVSLGIGLLVLYGISSVVRQILEPKLIGEGLGLHPLLSLAAMYAGLKLFGVWGMILAPLVTAGVKSVLY